MLYTTFKYIIFTALLFAAGSLLTQRVELINTVHHDVGGVEQNVIYGIQRLLDHQPLYSDPNKPPYAIIQYAPLYYHINAVVGPFARVKADKPLSVYRLSRTLSLIFNLLLIGLLVLWARRQIKAEWIYAISAGLLFFIYMRITDYSRPDSLYHLLYFLSLFMAFMGLRNKHNVAFLSAFILAAVALFTKQSAIVLPVILFSWMVLNRYNAKQWFMAIGVYSVSFVLLLLLFAKPDFSTFWANVYGGIDNGISWDWFYRRIIKLYGRELGLLATILFAVGIYARRFLQTKPVNFLFLSLIISFVFGMGTSLKWGSMPSYFTPFIGLGFLLWIHFFREAKGSKIPWTVTLFWLFTAFTLFAEFPVKLNMSDRPDEITKYEMASDIANWINKQNTSSQQNQYVMVLLDDGTLLDRSFINNELFRKAIFPQKDIVSCCAYPNQVFDYEQYKENGNQGLINYLIRYKWSDMHEYLGVTLDNFKEVQEIGHYSILKYNPENALD